MIAVFKSGGKQYKVTENQILEIEKIAGEKGDKVTFDQVLLLSDEKGTKVQVGKPLVAEATVEADIMSQKKGKKVKVMRYKNKTRQHTTQGHRHQRTQIKVKSIKA